jgi:hypothetical protein
LKVDPGKNTSRIVPDPHPFRISGSFQENGPWLRASRFRESVTTILIIRINRKTLKDDESMEEECCPKFDPEPWDGRMLEWEKKRFIRDRVRTFLFMPLTFGGVITRMNGKVEKAGANIPDWLCLSDHTSKWNMDVYLAVDREIPDAENVTLSGKFLSRVYEGPYQDTGEWCDDFKEYARQKGVEIKKWYMWYTTCPKCAKKYGKNYVAIVAEVK